MAREVTVKISATDSFSDVLRRYGQAMGQSAVITEQASQRSAGALENAANRIRTALDIGIAAGMLRTVQNVAENLNAVGTQFNQQSVLFERLAGEMGQSWESMRERLRAATLGVVDDLSLLSGANLVQRLGITDTPEELEELLGMIIRLKQPTEDVTTAIQNFGLMLSNQSLLRLDSFGLSSGRVKERMEELKEAGLDTAEAFRQATFEEMRGEVERLGGAADAAASGPLQRFQVRLENIFQRGASNFTTGANAIIGLIEAIGEAADRNSREAAAEIAANAAEEAAGIAFSQSIEEQLDAEGLGERFGHDFVEAALRAIAANPNLSDPFDIAEQMGFAGSMAFTGSQAESDAAIAAIEFIRQARAGALSTQAAASQRAFEQRRVGDLLLQMQQLRDFQAAQAAAAAPSPDLVRAGGDQANMEWQMQQFANLGGFARGQHTLPSGVLMPFGPAHTERLREAARGAAELLEQYEELAELNPDLGITDLEIEGMRNLRDEIGEAADEAQRLQENINNMSLSELFGQSRGGAAGEAMDAFAQYLRDQGVSQDAIDSFMTTANLMTGRETAQSRYFQQQALPGFFQIYQQGGVGGNKAAAQAIMDYIMGYQATLGSGQMPSDPFSFTGYGIGAPGKSGPGETGLPGGFSIFPIPAEQGPHGNQAGRGGGMDAATVEAGKLGFESMAGSMATMAQDAPILQNAMSDVAESAPPAAEAAGALSKHVGDAGDKALKLRDHMRDLAKTHVVKLKFEADVKGMPPWFLDLLNRGLATIIAQNGGTLPGLDARAK